MFKTAITSTPLTSDAANAYFEEKVFGNTWMRDTTFLATLRALLDPRMKENETVELRFTSSSYSVRDLNNAGERSAIGAVGNSSDNTISVHSFNAAMPDTNTAWMDFVEKNFERLRPGWHRLEKVTTFFRKVFRVLCYINPEVRNVSIFVDNLDISRMHYLQCGIFSFMPWYFDQEAGVSELEMDLIKSLRNKTPDRYQECLAKIAERYDFKTARIRQLLAGFETRYERVQCDDLRYRLQTTINSINELNERISSYLRQQRDYELALLGYETKIAQSEGEDSEIMEYFLCNKHLMLENVDDSNMKFIVTDYVSYFDEEAVRRVLDNPTSYIYRTDGRDRGNIIPHDDMKLLFEAIFIDESIKMRFCAAYQFQLAGNVSALRNYRYPSECSTYTPNPHIDRFGCMGDNGKIINERLRDHDYVGAIEQCIASCKSLNFCDSPVMSEFMNRIYGIGGYTMKCIELPDGKIVTPKEAINYLKEAAANG